MELFVLVFLWALQAHLVPLCQSCSWSRWKCKSHREDSSFQCLLIKTLQQPCLLNDTRIGDPKELGMHCPLLQGHDKHLWCSPFPQYNRTRHPFPNWCPWTLWGPWELDCADEVRTLTSSKPLRNQSHPAIQVRRRTRTCQCPSQRLEDPECAGSPIDVVWRQIPKTGALECNWCSWRPWGSCTCLGLSSQPRARYRRCVCSDGTVKYNDTRHYTHSFYDSFCAGPLRFFKHGNVDYDEVSCLSVDCSYNVSSEGSSINKNNSRFGSFLPSGFAEVFFVVCVVVVVSISACGVKRWCEMSSHSGASTPLGELEDEEDLADDDDVPQCSADADVKFHALPTCSTVSKSSCSNDDQTCIQKPAKILKVTLSNSETAC